MAKANKSRHAILGILAKAPGSSGYDIQSIMKQSTDFFWKETFSSIYPVLDALKNENLVTELDASPSGRKRKIYKITKDGLATFQSWLAQSVELETARNELLLKVFFGEMNSLESSINHIKNYQQQIAARKVYLDQVRQTLPKDYPQDQGLPFWLMTIDFAIRRIQASLEWCECSLETLSKLHKASKK